MNKVFTDNGWKDYVYWQTEDRKTLKKINNLTGYWSRRINDKERLIYKIDDENVYIVACRYHYSDT